MKNDIVEFVRESNAIEKIFREPTQEEINEHIRFMAIEKMTVEELEKFVAVYQPRTKLRDKYNLNVKVGLYYPPFGNPQLKQWLQHILDTNYDAYDLHINYELLHPFTDCNGRSGRALWAWRNRNIKGGFLLNFYYQTLQSHSRSMSWNPLWK